MYISKQAGQATQAMLKLRIVQSARSSRGCAHSLEDEIVWIESEREDSNNMVL